MLGLPPRPQAAALASTFVAVWMRNGIALDGALISFQNHFIYLFIFLYTESAKGQICSSLPCFDFPGANLGCELQSRRQRALCASLPLAHLRGRTGALCTHTCTRGAPKPCFASVLFPVPAGVL